MVHACFRGYRATTTNELDLFDLSFAFDFAFWKCSGPGQNKLSASVANGSAGSADGHG